MAWDVLDFVVFGAMLPGVGLIYTPAARKTGNTGYRFGVGVALWLISARLFRNAARQQLAAGAEPED